jgi:fatty acid desaturase
VNKLIPQRVYARTLRAHLPREAFEPDPSKLYLLVINLLILSFGWAMGSQLAHWPTQWLWLYLPFALIMANSVTVLAFLSHDLMHGSVIRNYRLASKLAVVTQSVLWMPPTLWKIVHNRVHHNRTNMIGDPDRNYFLHQPNTFGKGVQSLLFPSSKQALPWLVFGMLTMWGMYAFRNLLSALFWKGRSAELAPATFTVTQRERLAIAGELAVIIVIHLLILSSLSFNLLQIALAYLLPLSFGYAGMMAYIFTNHLLSPATAINDPLANSLSLKLPMCMDVLHVHFSYHAEHHIFPGLNSDYYPLVRELLSQYYGDRMGYLVSGAEAWKMLLSTPRQYLDNITLVSRSGKEQAPCHLIFDMEKSRLPTK